MLDLLLNFDDYLRQLAATYPGWIYGLLWLVLFLENRILSRVAFFCREMAYSLPSEYSAPEGC